MEQRFWQITAVLLVMLLGGVGRAVVLRCQCAVEYQAETCCRQCPGASSDAAPAIGRCRKAAAADSRPTCPRRRPVSKPCCVALCPHAVWLREKSPLFYNRIVRRSIDAGAPTPIAAVRVEVAAAVAHTLRRESCDLGPPVFRPGSSPQALLATFNC